MLRKVFRTGNSVVISFPKEYLEALRIDPGSEVNIELDRKHHRLMITPIRKQPELYGIDEEFSRQVSEFIEKYRPALEELAKNA